MTKEQQRFDILGKDFLSVAEAAHYCCLSPRWLLLESLKSSPIHHSSTMIGNE